MKVKGFESYLFNDSICFENDSFVCTRKDTIFWFEEKKIYKMKKKYSEIDH